MKKIVFVVFIMALALIMLAGCECKHEWEPATCKAPRTCSLCGETEGSALGHVWQTATCTSPKKCTRCGASEGSAIGHTWQAATCTSPKKCKKCGVSEGSALGHNWEEATCTTPKTCSRCNQTEGTPRSHIMADYVCTLCGKTIITKSDVPNILDIESMSYKLNSVGGIDLWIIIRNKSSSKTIKYVEYNVSFFNRVGDKIRDEVSGRDKRILEYTGPLGPDEQSNSNQYWKACFYNTTFGGTMHFNSIIIIYTDGSTLMLDNSIADSAVVAWR